MIAGPNNLIEAAFFHTIFFKKLGTSDKRDADVIWVYNMMGPEMGISQHNMCSCSVTSYGDLLFVNTGNGLDESHLNLPAPDAPSFICMNKNTGEVLVCDIPEDDPGNKKELRCRVKLRYTFKSKSVQESQSPSSKT